MHDYTAWLIHDDRMRDLTRDAEASMLAAIAKEGRPARHPGAGVLRLLRSGLLRISRRRGDPGAEDLPSRPTTVAKAGSGAATALSVSSIGDR